ncbi:MAG: tail fiber domain-containing protein [Ferruginibacter sp.]
MKKIFCILFVTTYLSEAFSQNIGIGTTTPDPSAALEIKSTTKGFLTPRMIVNSRLAISGPANGLLVYDTDYDGYWYHNDTGWVEIETVDKLNGWGLKGSGAINPAANFIGTTNNQPLHFRLSNQWAGELNPVTQNYSVGVNAGKHVTTGQYNIAIGDNALDTNKTGSDNIAIGTNVLTNCTGGDNTIVGSYAFEKAQGSYNTAVGFITFSRTNGGNYNTALGGQAGLLGSVNLSYATAIGSNSLVGCSNCLALGGQDDGTNFSSPSFVGINNAIPAYSMDIQQINNRGIVLRHPSDNNSLNTWEIYHAPNPYANLPNLASDLVLFYNGSPVGAFNNSNGAYTALSDERMKTNIETMPSMIEKIKLLKPLSYHYINNNTFNKQSLGFLAQDIEKIFPQFIHIINTEGKNIDYENVLAVDYSGFGTVAIKAIQEQQKIIHQQQDQIDQIKELIELLKKRN